MLNKSDAQGNITIETKSLEDMLLILKALNTLKSILYPTNIDGLEETIVLIEKNKARDLAYTFFFEAKGKTTYQANIASLLSSLNTYYPQVTKLPYAKINFDYTDLTRSLYKRVDTTIIIENNTQKELYESTVNIPVK